MRGAALRALLDAGVVTERRERRERDPFASLAGSPPPGEPTEQQRSALRALQMLSEGEVGAAVRRDRQRQDAGVPGVPAAPGRRRGRSVIVLVPEIGLTPQTVARFRGVFGDAVAVLHSGLSDGERYDAWRALQSGRKRVAVGARSAVFAAVPRLGAIVVDEEHDASYKQADPAPRYHARQVAMRPCGAGRREGDPRERDAIARDVGGGGAEEDHDHRVAGADRIPAAARVQVVDMRHAPAPTGPVP